MIYGPCGNLNCSSVCIADGICTKSSPKNGINDTITNVDRYPIYRVLVIIIPNHLIVEFIEFNLFRGFIFISKIQN